MFAVMCCLGEFDKVELHFVQYNFAFSIWMINPIILVQVFSINFNSFSLIFTCFSMKILYQKFIAMYTNTHSNESCGQLSKVGHATLLYVDIHEQSILIEYSPKVYCKNQLRTENLL